MKTTSDDRDLARREIEAGRLESAQQHLRRFLKHTPDDVPAMLMLAQTVRMQGQPAEAEPIYQKALRARPGHPDALYQLASTYKDLGQNDLAERTFGQLLELAPNHAEGLSGLGALRAGQKRYDEALPLLERAVKARPEYAQGHHNLGVCLGLSGRREEAVNELQEAIRLRADYTEAWYNLGSVLDLLKRREESIVMLRQALRLNPKHTGARTNLFHVLHKLGRFSEAQTSILEALREQPTSAEMHANLGTVLQMQGRIRESLACFDVALRFDPHCAMAQYNRATTLLVRGKWLEGWPGYEYRFGLDGKVSHQYRHYPQPRWNGGPLDGKRIVVWAEQGLGDVLQFVRFAPQLAARGAKVIVECPRSMAAIVRTASGIERVAAEGDPASQADLHTPVASLPGLLKTTVATIPADVPYLHAPAEKIERWQQILGPKRGLRVGIAWRGNPDHGHDHWRSIALRRFAPLAAMPGVELISLQKGPPRAEIAQVSGKFAVWESPVPDPEDAGESLLETAALICCLDLVICVDTAVAHLTGALAKPVWVALAAKPDWRWLNRGTRTNWYPTMRLYRQKRLCRWRDVFARMAADLAKLAAASGAGP
jgi:tetratricopeptide (TPR) repeat protein